MKATKKPEVILYTSEYGQFSEVWIHRQVAALRCYISGVAAHEFFNQDTFQPENPLRFGWENDWHHRRSHLYWAVRKCRWVADDELDILENARRLTRTGCSLIHCHYLWNSSFTMALAKHIGVPLIVTAHGSDVNRARVDKSYRERLVEVFDYSSCIIAVSEFIAGVLLEIGCPPEKITVIPLGAPIPDQVAPRNGDVFRWICVASFRKVKGHEYLIRAFATALEDNPDMELVLVGEGGLRDHLEALVAKLGLDERVRFTGARTSDEVMQLLLVSHGFVLASIVEKGENLWKEEGLPISMVEAASVGLPLVGTNCGGIPEICRDRENGILVSCESVPELVAALLAISQNREMAVAMSATSRELAEREFNIVNQNHKLAALYKSLVFD